MLSKNDSVPLVSVIIPVYNVEKYLRECLDSIVNQTLKDIEVICIDDGSQDSSLEILKEYASYDKRIIILKQENSGAALARNYGISIAKGKYLSFLDSDDIFSLEMLEKAVRQAESFDADITIFKAMSFDTNSNRTAEMNNNNALYERFKNKYFSYKDIPNDIFNSFLVPAWNKLFKRSFVLENEIFFQNIKRCNDLFFTSKSLVLAKRIVLLDEMLLYYRVGIKSNLQSGNDKTPLEFYKALMVLKKFFDESEVYGVVRTSFIKLSLDNIFYNLNSVKSDEARNLIIYKLRKDGFYILGIQEYKNIQQISFTGYMQYKYVCVSSNKYILKGLYGFHKLVEYYKMTGFKNMLKKAILK